MPVVHCKEDTYDVYIGRPSKWSNPYTSKKSKYAKYTVSSRAEAITFYESHLKEQIINGDISISELAELDGKILGCYCHPKPCHGNIILSAAKWAKTKLQNYERMNNDRCNNIIQNKYR